MFSKPTFGATPVASSSFGFGSSNANANLFGQPTSLFGKPATPGFGATSSTFGSTAPMFGSTTAPLFQNTSTATFGANQNQPAFGSTLFGSQQNAPSSNLFGSNTTTFGQQNKQVGFGFGSTNTTNRLFGQPSATPFQPSSSAGLFGGSSTFGSTQTGTVIKFNPVTGTDTMQKGGVTTNINTKHHCITCMKEYEGKSLEELRLEDYQANRKGPQQQPGFGVTPFGSTGTSSAPPLFGQTADNKTGFGTTGAFSQSSGFGMGQPQANQSGGLFGKPSTSFGTTTTSSTFGFNSAPSSNLFSSNTTQPFSQSKPLFGAPSTQPSGFGSSNIFGQTPAQPTHTGLFGQQQSSGFGLNTGFGQMQQNQGGLFQTSKPASTFGPFTTQTITSAPSFGQSASTFGQSNAFSGFGKPAQSTFGTQQTSFGAGLGSQNTSNLFGSMQQKPGGFFGSTNTSGLFSGGTTFQPSTGFNMQPMQPQVNTFQQTTDQSEELKQLLQSADIFGRDKIFNGLTPLKDNENRRTTNPRELKTILDNSMKVKPPSLTKYKPNMSSMNKSKLDVFDGTMSKSDYDSQNFIKMTGKRLVINKKGEQAKTSNVSDISLFDFGGDDVSSFRNSLPKSKTHLETDSSDKMVTANTSFERNGLEEIVMNINDNCSSQSTSATDLPSDSHTTFETIYDEDKDYEQLSEDKPVSQKHPCGIILTRPEYYTIPPLNELPKFMKEDGSCIVKGLTIGRLGYGNVYYPDPMDASNLNLDKIIFFRQGEIIVYPDEASTPPVGQGLNRKAQVTLDNVWPKTKDGSIVLTDLKEINAINFIEKLKQICERRSSQFVEYRPETGSWVFKVEHFSKHGFSDSDEEEVENRVKNYRNKKDLKTVPDNKELPASSSKEKFFMAMQNVGQEEQKSLSTSSDTDIYSISDSVGLGGSRLDLPKPTSITNEEFVMNETTNNATMNIYPTLRVSRNFIYKEVNPTNIEMMKCSFFDENESNSNEALLEPLTTDISRFSDLSEERALIDAPREVSLLPKSFQLLNKHQLLPSAKSVLNTHRNYKDMSIFLGRSFKPGWSVGGKLATLSRNNDLHFCSLSQYCEDQNPFIDQIADYLQVVMDNTNIEVGPAGVPLMEISSAQDLLYQLQKVIHLNLACHDYSQTLFYYSCIWDLVVALWMPHENLTRRDVFSNWLKTTVAYDVENEVNSPSSFELNINRVYNKIFTYLSGNQINEAAKFALSSNLPQLSLLISQLNTVSSVQNFFAKQFSQWKQTGMLKYIDENLLKVYLLLTGITVHEEINVCKDLDWRRAFGIHLWYTVPVELPIAVVMKEFQKSFGELCYARKPSPPHNNIDPNVSDKYDILYHIINLFVDPRGTLQPLLEPVTYTGNPLDYSVSWLFLKIFEGLNIGKKGENVNDYVHMSFADQLESLGLWHWAIFVLLFLKNTTTKKDLIVKILERHVSSSLEEETTALEDFLVNEFRIPTEWIHLAKGRRAQLEGKDWEACRHMILSKQWTDGHEIAFSGIFPDLVIHNDFDSLEAILEEFIPGEKIISNWNLKGGLLYDLVNLWKSISSKEDYEFEQLSLHDTEQSIFDLLGRLKKFPISSEKQALCISECSKYLAFLIKRFYLDLQNKTHSNICKTSSFIESLVIPPDYKQSEVIKSLLNMVQIQMV